MDHPEIEELLHESEGTALDFKSEQYQFVDATNEQKSELLKDILAFANSWRRTDAYILVGVQESQAGRSTPVGVETHLDDASLQEFVNSKTNRRVEFRYLAVDLDGRSVGVIQIARQTRPTVLTKDFGKLRRDVVYVRQGSGTAVATGPEIYGMGAADAAERSPSQPRLSVQLAMRRDRRKCGDEVHLALVAHGEPAQLPDYGSSFVVSIGENRNYWRQLEEYVRVTKAHGAVSLVVSNTSGAVATNVRVQLTAPRAAGFTARTSREMPRVPSSGWLAPPEILRGSPRPDISIEQFDTSLLVEASFDRVQPKSESWLSDSFFVSRADSGLVAVCARVTADNLANPVEASLSLVFEVTKSRSITIADLRELDARLDGSD